MLLPQLLKQEGLVTVMVMALMMVPDYSEGHTACTAITTIYNTTVTCLFPEDISQLGFNVQFFFPNTSADPEMLLVCNRLTSGGLTCHKGHQVLFDEKQKIAHRFTLSRPPSLSKLNRGHYQCHAVPSLTDRSEFCPLTYKDISWLVPLESLRPPPKDGNDAIQIFMLVAIVIILILLIVMISAGFCLWAKRNRRAAEKERPGDVEDATEDILLTGLETRIPEGLAQDYYNMGWREALNDETNRMTADEPSPVKSIESSTQTTIQHDKRDPQVEGGEQRAAADVHHASGQSSQGAALRPQPMRDRRGPRSKTTLIYGSRQRDQDYPAQQLVRQSSLPTLIDSEDQSSEKQKEAAEELAPMMREGGPDTEKAHQSKKPGKIRQFLKTFHGKSDTSEHGARGESKEGNTRPRKNSENEHKRERQERENRETRGGQGSYGGQTTGGQGSYGGQTTGGQGSYGGQTTGGQGSYGGQTTGGQGSYGGQTTGGQGSYGGEGTDIKAKENQEKSETKTNEKKKWFWQ